MRETRCGGDSGGGCLHEGEERRGSRLGKGIVQRRDAECLFGLSWSFDWTPRTKDELAAENKPTWEVRWSVAKTNRSVGRGAK